jgi:hypothetical protein
MLMRTISSSLTLSRSLRVWALFVGIVCASMLVVGSARADFGVRPDPGNPAQPDFHVEILQSDEVTPFTQAGGHPFQMSTIMNFNRTPSDMPDGRVKNIVVDLPVGFVGDPTAAPTCTYAQLRDNADCPIQAQVGTLTLDANIGSGVETNTVPVWNMVAAPGDVATFAFNIVNILTSVHLTVRSDSDYGIRATVRDASSYLPVLGTRLTIWGVPADASHDPFRGLCLNLDGTSNGICPAGMPPEPFLTSPSDCSAGPLGATLRVTSWNAPNDVKTYASAPSPVVDGCDKLLFEPTLTFQPTMDQAGAPSGFSTHINVPQNLAAVGVATPPLRKAVVTLPLGVSISPASVNGLGACSDAQIGLNSLAPAACPDSSKIGSVQIDTPLLPEPLTGDVFVGQQMLDQTFRIFVEVAGQGVRVKLSGDVDPNPITGQITATFNNNPQLPFSDFRLAFNGGPHSALMSPRGCGTYTTRAELTPWSAPTTPVASTTDSFTITKGIGGGACGAPGFDPKLEAGTVSPAAGEHSPFTLTLTRGDGDQFLRGLSVDMPVGLLASIASVPVLCPTAQAIAGTCGEGSRVGTVTTGAGPGSDPFFVSGRAYLTEAYRERGAPFGLAMVVPVIAGPYNLGTVVVRAAVFIDRHTSAVRIVSDPLPTILEGVPLQVRTVNVHVDRDGFMLNPTSCDAAQIRAQVTSTEGASANLSTRFQVAGCGGLPFAPRMQIRVGGRGRTQRGRSTPLEATVRMTPGQANLRSVQVRLPTTINARLNIINRACTRAEFDAGNCAKAKAGTAVAVTPLLRDPLKGDVFFVRNGRALPDVMVALKGQVEFDLVGRVTIPQSKFLATNFDTVPDVPITKFTLRFVSGSQGPVGTAANLCTRRSRRARMSATFTAQSGKVVRASQRLGIRGCRGRASASGKSSGGRR